MPQVGENLNLSMKLHDADATKFVRAVLRDNAGVLLPASPVVLTHIGEGQYTNNSVLMPNTQKVTASIQVFDDAAFTILSDNHWDGTQVFALDIPDSEFLALLLEIKSMLIGLTASSTSSADIVGVVRGVDKIIGKVVTGQKITGTVKQDMLRGIVEIGERVKGLIEQQSTIIGEVE